MNFFFGNNGLGKNQMERLAEHYYTAPATDITDPVTTYWKAVCRSQLEIWALANRRARKALTLPSQLAVNTSPAGLFGVYADFWATAFTEYADTTQRIGGLFNGPVQKVPAKTAEIQRPVLAKRSKPAKAKLNGARYAGSEELRQAS